MTSKLMRCGLCSCLLLPILISAPVIASDFAEASDVRQLEVTVIKGKNLPALLNKNIDGYSIMAVVNNELEAIPFQFDDKNIRGLTYVPGGRLEVKGQAGVFEEDDELAFMYKDMESQATTEMRNMISGEVISELEISEKNSSRYAYVVKGNAQRSLKSYASYNMDTGLVTTENYTLNIDPNNIFVWEDWRHNGFEGTPSAPNVLDTMKIRIYAKLGFLGATLHNSLIPIKTLAAKNGPVRAIVEADGSVRMLGIKLATSGLSATFTSQTIEYPLYLKIPRAAGALSDFRMDVTYDFVGFEGSRFRSALGPKEPLITGSEESRKLYKNYKMDLDNPWVSLSTGKNWDMIHLFKHSDNFKPTLNTVYKDVSAGHKANKPERYKGSSSEFGTSLSDVPVGQGGASLEYVTYIGPNLWQGNNPEMAVYELMHPAKVKVNE